MSTMDAYLQSVMIRKDWKVVPPIVPPALLLLGYLLYNKQNRHSSYLVLLAGSICCLGFLSIRKHVKIPSIVPRWMSLRAPQSDSAREIARLESLFGRVHPKFFQGSYQEAATEAVVSGKLLLAYFHTKSNPQCDELCKNIFFFNSAQESLEFLSQHFLCWFVDSSENDLKSQLAVQTTPHIAILNSDHAGDLFLISQFYGETLDDLISKLQQIVFQLEQDQLLAEAELENDRMLMEQQDLEYQKSLDMDREKQQQLAKQREEENNKLQVALQRQKLLELKRTSLPPEPTVGDVISLAFQLPNGVRLKRGFLGSDPLQMVYDFIDSHPQNAGVMENYELVSNYPKKRFIEKAKSIRDVGLQDKTLLFPQEQ